METLQTPQIIAPEVQPIDSTFIALHDAADPTAHDKVHEQDIDPDLELLLGAIEAEGFQYEDGENGQLGRANSAHNVRFGVLTDAQGQTQRVAVKTFEGKGKRPTKRAQNEHRTMAKVQELGFQSLDPYETPIFSIPNEEGETVFAVSKQRDELKPMNGLDWQKDPGDNGFEDMTALMEEIADFTAEMHAAGIVHNDWQLKNVIMNTQGEFVLVDMEKAMVHREGLSPTTDPQQLTRDVRVHFVSLLDNGFMPNSPMRVVYDHIEQHFVDRYLESLRTYAVGNVVSDDSKRALLIKGVEEAVITAIHEVEENRARGDLEKPREEVVARYAGRAIAELAEVQIEPVLG